MASKPSLPAYLIVGTDEFRRSKVVSKMKASLADSGMADFNLDERNMSKDPQIDDVIASLNTLPIGAEFRLVILEGCDKLPKAASEPLVEYLSNPCPSTVCVIIADKLAKGTRLYKAILKIDSKAIIECSPVKGRDLPRHIVDIASRYGRDISYDAAEELASRVGENMRLLDTELRRLFELVHTSRIELSDVERSVAQTAEVKPWGLVDAVAARDGVRALHLLAAQPKKNEVWIHSLIVARLRELVIAKSLVDRGASAQIASSLGLQSWQVRNHAKWARAFTMDELIELLDAAAETELALKGSRDSSLALQLLILRICR